MPSPILRITKFLIELLYSLLAILCLILLVRGCFLTPEIGLTVLNPNDRLEFPTHMAEIPTAPQHFIVAEKPGRLKLLHAEDREVESTLLDISSKVAINHLEDGLLSVAIPPNFRAHPYIYIYYTIDSPLRTRLSRYAYNFEKKELQKPEEIVLEIPQARPGHNGGMIAFASNESLFLSIGDSHLEPSKLLRWKDLRGSLIRIDPTKRTAGKNYAIPKNNPFVGKANKPPAEVYAYGFRNPWRYSIDPQSNKLILGDVGRNTYEEINLVKKGKHYGWPVIEGLSCNLKDKKPLCRKNEFESPFLALQHGLLTRSVNAGFLYRGKNLPELKGHYIFGDYLRGIWRQKLDAPERPMLLPDDVLLWRPPSYHDSNLSQRMSFTSFATDRRGEIYVLSVQGGIFRISSLPFFNKVLGFCFSLVNF